MATLSEIINLLGTDPATVRGWLDHAELRSFFSEAALAQISDDQRQLSDEDVLVLSTINQLRKRTGRMTWPEIAAYLESGQRKVEATPSDTQLVKTVRIEYPEYETALKRIMELEHENARLREEINQLRARLNISES